MKQIMTLTEKLDQIADLITAICVLTLGLTALIIALFAFIAYSL